jgi:hypothetical protein
MLKSAEYFLAGFFGLEWTKNATVEVIIEDFGFNNSLAGYENCRNANLPVSGGGNNATVIWSSIYLQNATERLQSMVKGYDWTVADTYAAQGLCPYETVSSTHPPSFCDLLRCLFRLPTATVSFVTSSRMKNGCITPIP